MTPKQYDYFLFDWDGCLARTLPVWLEVFREVSAEYGQHPTTRQIANHLGDWGIAKELGIDDAEGFIKKSIALARPRLLQVGLYDGAAESLRALKAADKKLALLSSTVRDALETGLEYNELTEVFDVVLAGEDVVKHKPDPEIIQTALASLGAAPDRAIMIGDSDKDLGAANNAGVDSVLFFPPDHEFLYDLEQLRALRPTYVVAGFQELQRLLGL
jgi:pyrophosphatase PpaX